MTVELPKPTFGDKVLDMMGKKRAVFVPKDVYREYGPHAYAKASKESFLRALLRPKGADPPEGWVYLDDREKKGDGRG
ncbi:MAG TPA: hypothetical protein P5308_06835 [Syntrophales bacterium]|nr:hypothetical protein [Syntrophales bacterium]